MMDPRLCSWPVKWVTAVLWMLNSSHTRVYAHNRRGHMRAHVYQILFVGSPLEIVSRALLQTRRNVSFYQLSIRFVCFCFACCKTLQFCARRIKSTEHLERERQAAELPAHLSAMFRKKIVGPGGATLDLIFLQGKILGIYFSAYWYRPCRQFTPNLAAKYGDIITAGQPLEIVFVSSGARIVCRVKRIPTPKRCRRKRCHVASKANNMLWKRSSRYRAFPRLCFSTSMASYDPRWPSPPS
jgi:hypothetical protein